VREASGKAAFVPPDEVHQMVQGEAVLNVLTATGARVIAEDLGVIPKFVRQTLDRLEIPGYKVLRWEREWDAPGEPFKDPLKYPACSVATSATHDTETIAEWWDEAPIEERKALAAIDPLLQLRVRDVARHDDGARQREPRADRMLRELSADLAHRQVQVDLHRMPAELLARLDQ